ncbi:MAG: BON domain-containing protein [Deltaproteobacteria bacterium]|nr:BON domain-containing protein [Deltaproteobacteria bacterium]
MNPVKLGLLVGILGMGSVGNVALAADKAAQKDRIEDRADQKKDQIDRNADRQKAKVDEDAERAKDRVDGKDRDGKVTANEKTSVGEEVTDAWITTKVKSSFIGEDALKGSDISVDTENKGVVVLTGTAPTVGARLRAASLAASVKGVRSVRNDIRIAPAR